MKTNCHKRKDSAFKKDLLIATFPTLIAIVAQKLMDEVFEHFARKRSKEAEDAELDEDDDDTESDDSDKPET